MVDVTEETSGRWVDNWDAVVFDLDGTLVELIVDWDALERDLAGALSEAGLGDESTSAWELLEMAQEAGMRELAESVIAPVETAGAKQSDRLPLADVVPTISGPVAVCSLNCEAAVRTALDTHGLSGNVDAVVGRDTLEVWKPNPKPLLESVERIGACPDETVFVGDSARDRTTAKRAGVDFRWVRETIASLD